VREDGIRMTLSRATVIRFPCTGRIGVI